jgi:hypothetical protein
MTIDRRTRVLVASIAVACGALLGGERLARSDDPAAAEALFKEGKRLLKGGQVAAACQKLAESQRLDPSSGTLLNLASCHEQEGKTATAWAEFLAAARLARAQTRKDRAKEAETRAAALEPQLSYLTVEVPVVTQGLEVLRDGTKLDQGAFGSKIPIDPGEHEITARAPSCRDWSVRVSVGKASDAKVITVPALTPSAAQPAGSASAAPAPGPAPVPAPVSAPAPAASAAAASSPPARSSPTLAYVVGGVGIVATGVGAAFGMMALSAHKDAEALCPSYKGCSDAALDKRDQAGTRATIANVGIGLGLVGIGVGTYLLLASGSGKDAAAPEKAGLVWEPVVGRGGAGAAVSGRF